MIKVLLKILLPFYFATGFCQTDSEATFKRLFINEEKYSIMFPSNWTLKYKDSLRNSFMLLSPKSDEKDDYIENLSLHISDLGNSKVKPKMIKEIVDRRFKVSSEIISNRNITKNKLIGQEIVYKNLSQGILSTILQYYFVKGRDLYILTFCCKSSEYLQNIPVAQSIIETFMIK